MNSNTVYFGDFLLILGAMLPALVAADYLFDAVWKWVRR